jgi:hypothetical protein
LLLGWIDAILKHFTHISFLAQKWQEVNGFPLCPCPKQGSRPSSPCLEGQGLSGALHGESIQPIVVPQHSVWHRYMATGVDTP